MRHRNVGTILDRKKAPRQALIRGLATNLVLYEKIQTTDARARALRPFVERLITTGKSGDLNARRELIRVLYTPNAVKKVLEVLSPRYKTRPGGYTRILKLGQRKGDAALMVQIEFVS